MTKLAIRKGLMKLKFFPRKTNIVLLIFFILLGVTGIFLEKFSSG